MAIKFERAQSLRRHRVGRARIDFVIANAHTSWQQVGPEGRVERWWVGIDQRGTELEVMAWIEDDVTILVHAMPTHYRRKGKTP